MKRFFYIVCIIFICCGCGRERNIVTVKNSIKEVNYSSIYHIINNYDLYKDITIIDIRDSDKYDSGHIIGADNVLVTEFLDLEIDSNSRVIVYGDNKRDSIVACKKLQLIGVDADYMPGINNYPYELV